MADDTKKDQVNPKDVSDSKGKANTNSKTVDTAEQKLVEAVKGLFEENKKLKKLFVTEDAQAFLESNLQYALRHAKINKMKLFEVNRNLEIEEFSEPENND